MGKRKRENIELNVNLGVQNNCIFATLEDYVLYRGENTNQKHYEILRTDKECRIYIKINFEKSEYPLLFEEGENDTKRLISCFGKEFIGKLCILCGANVQDIFTIWSPEKLTDKDEISTLEILIKNIYLPNKRKTISIIKKVFENINRGFTGFYKNIDMEQYNKFTLKEIKDIDNLVTRMADDRKIELFDIKNKNILNNSELIFIDEKTFSEETKKFLEKKLGNFEFEKYLNGEYIFEFVGGHEYYCPFCGDSCDLKKIHLSRNMNDEMESKCPNSLYKREILEVKHSKMVNDIIQQEDSDFFPNKIEYESENMRPYDFSR